MPSPAPYPFWAEQTGGHRFEGGFSFGRLGDESIQWPGLPAILNGRRIVASGVGTIPKDTRAHDGESHRHLQAEVFVISRGRVYVPECTDSPLVGPGEWIFVPPDVEHHLTTPIDSDCTALWMLLENQ